jgi:hypothetical protein
MTCIFIDTLFVLVTTIVSPHATQVASTNSPAIQTRAPWNSLALPTLPPRSSVTGRASAQDWTYHSEYWAFFIFTFSLLSFSKV